VDAEGIFDLFHRSHGRFEEVRVMVKRGDIWEVGGILQLLPEEWQRFRDAVPFPVKSFEAVKIEAVKVEWKKQTNEVESIPE
jgi:hypothetical protein